MCVGMVAPPFYGKQMIRPMVYCTITTGDLPKDAMRKLEVANHLLDMSIEDTIAEAETRIEGFIRI